MQNIDKMPQSTFDEIKEKYVEMSVTHPFREGNGRRTRIWLDLMLKKEIGYIVDWSKVEKEDYLLAMERSLIKDITIRATMYTKPRNGNRVRDIGLKWEEDIRCDTFLLQRQRKNGMYRREVFVIRRSF